MSRQKDAWSGLNNLDRSAGGSSFLDGFQTGLDVAGLVPVVGEAADGVNALIYTIRGDYVSAGLSEAGMIPFAGWAATGGKLLKKGGRVFWSGGDVAKNAAMDFAKANGMKTLEMTTGGRIMNSVGPYLPRSISSPIWDGLSRNFARGASGNINIFQNAAGVSLNRTWRRIEYPILQNNNIFYHIVK